MSWSGIESKFTIMYFTFSLQCICFHVYSNDCITYEQQIIFANKNHITATRLFQFYPVIKYKISEAHFFNAYVLWYLNYYMEKCKIFHCTSAESFNSQLCNIAEIKRKSGHVFRHKFLSLWECCSHIISN